MKRALITGITGQDGSYLAELLLNQGYEVHGTIRRSSTVTTGRIAHILDRLTLHCADLLDQSCLNKLLKDVRPTEVYNLASQSFVPTSWDQPEFTTSVTGLGCLRVLEAIKQAGLASTRFYQASTSEMFGEVAETPQNEQTPFHPRSPYGCAKCFAHYITQNYRESFGMFACSGILFNHESPRRGLEFVTRKITSSVARIARGMQSSLKLGNITARRDWGHAGDYVRAMWMMLQAKQPEDYVVATNTSFSIEEFAKAAFEQVNLRWEDFVVVDPTLARPAEVWLLQGDYSRIYKNLGWSPQTTISQLVEEMVKTDLNLLNKE